MVGSASPIGEIISPTKDNLGWYIINKIKPRLEGMESSICDFTTVHGVVFFTHKRE